MIHFKTKTKHPKEKADVEAGNFIVIHGHDFIDKLIQIFTMSHWNHAALVVFTNGTIIELHTNGIKKNNISEYDAQDIHIVDIDMSVEDRKQVVKYADFMLKKHESYGFMTIVSIAFKIITRSRLIIKFDGTMICSEFVARALSQGGVIWEQDPALITPADLYNRFIKKP